MARNGDGGRVSSPLGTALAGARARRDTSRRRLRFRAIAWRGVAGGGPSLGDARVLCSLPNSGLRFRTSFSGAVSAFSFVDVAMDRLEDGALRFYDTVVLFFSGNC